MTATTPAMAATRDALHQVAEHVLAAAQYAQLGTIQLRIVAGGFETMDTLPGNRRLAVINGQVVVTDDSGARSAPLTTVRAAADFIGSTAGLSPTAYPPATRLLPDAPLTIDANSAVVLSDWYRLADEALRRFAADVGAPPLQPVLWPEHFDVGITVDKINYGASPGDAEIADPYVYVGPHNGPPRRDTFWNADFGAARTIDEINGSDDAVAFFRTGCDWRTPTPRRSSNEVPGYFPERWRSIAIRRCRSGILPRKPGSPIRTGGSHGPIGCSTPSDCLHLTGVCHRDCHRACPAPLGIDAVTFAVRSSRHCRCPHLRGHAER